MYHRLIASLLLFGMSLGASAARAGSLDGVRDTAVVVIATAKDKEAVGSGVVVDATPTHIRVLTARHVALFGELVVRIHGSSRRAHIVRTWPDHDLALIDAEVDPMHFGSIQSAHVGAPGSAGAPIFVLGSGDTFDAALLPGSIDALNPALPDGPANGRFTIACAKCAHGDSGSGIFDQDGMLIGILSAAWVTPTGQVVMLVAEPATEILQTSAPAGASVAVK
jgi:hypothetical protein